MNHLRVKLDRNLEDDNYNSMNTRDCTSNECGSIKVIFSLAQNNNCLDNSPAAKIISSLKQEANVSEICLIIKASLVAK